MEGQIGVVVYGHITIFGPIGHTIFPGKKMILPPKVSYNILRRFNFIHMEVVKFIERNYVDIARQNFYCCAPMYDQLEFLDNMKCVKEFYDSLI